MQSEEDISVKIVFVQVVSFMGGKPVWGVNVT